MLGFDGWINGIVATGCFIFAIILGLGIIFQARKLHAKLLFLIGLNIFLTSFFWIITFFDFMTIVFTGRNLVLPSHLIGLITYLLAPFITLISLYIGAELMTPTKKKIVVMPGHDNIEVPIVDKKNAQVLSISNNKANVMDSETYETFDLEIPDELKEEVVEGCTVLYWIILDQKVIKQVKG